MRNTWRWAALSLTLAAGCGAALEVAPPEAHTEAQTVIKPEAQPRAAQLGDSYDTATEQLGPACVEVEVESQLLGARTGHVLVDRTDDSESVERELGFSLNAKGRYLTYSGSVASKLLQTMKEDRYSRVFIYSSEYKTGTRARKRVTQVTHSPFLWRKDCGNEMVDQISYGGRFYYVFRIDFVSSEAKDSFEAQLKAEMSQGVGGVSLETALKNVGKRLSRRGAVHVEAFQFGGDPGRLGAVITGATVQKDSSNGAGYAVVDCDLAALDRCQQMLRNAIDYTNPDVQGSFGWQIEQERTGGQLSNPIQYLTEEYGRVKEGLGAERVEVDQQVIGARAILRDKFDRIMRAWLRVNRMLSRFTGMPSAQVQELETWKTRLTTRLGEVDLAVRACYDDMLATLPINPGPCVTRAAAIDASEPGDELLRAYGRYAIDAKHASLRAGGVDLGTPLSRFLCFYDIRTHRQVCQPGPAREHETTGPDGIGLLRRYQGGTIYWSADTEPFEVYGDILRKYALLGEASSLLRFPVSGELPTMGRDRTSLFQDGSIYYWWDTRSAFEVRGDLYLRWQQEGQWSGVLGRPVSDTLVPASGGLASLFERGAIYWREGNPSGNDPAFVRKTRVVKGAIYTGWSDNGRDGGLFGYPLTEEKDGYQEFSGGDIYWNGWREAIGVVGPIAVKYRAMKSANTSQDRLALLGLPIDHAVWYPDWSVPQYQAFERGRIYYDRSSGITAALHGQIYQRYAQLGYHAGLGMPVSSVEQEPARFIDHARFTGGAIYQTTHGPLVVRGRIYDQYRALGGVAACGLPIDEETFHDMDFARDYWRQNFERGSIEYRGSLDVVGEQPFTAGCH